MIAQMISLLLRSSFFVILLLDALSIAAQEPTSADATQDPTSSVAASSDDQASATETGTPDLGTPDLGTPDAVVPDAGLRVDGDGKPSGDISAAAPPAEYLQELGQRVTKFSSLRMELEKALGNQREAYIRYANREPGSSESEESFYALRRKVREILDETYLAALDVVRFGLDEEAATFVVTMILHRLNLDIYNATTMEGAARLIDGGSKLTYLYQAAARSAMVEGRFEMAKRLFESIGEDQKEELDRTLEFLLEDYKASFEAESVIRAKEAKEDRLPRVEIRTTQGDLVVELFLDQAPSAVSNFIGLVEQGFYDDLDFHQVIDHLLALTGDSSGDGGGNSGKFLIDEHDAEDARKAFRGSLVMAKMPVGETGKFVPNSASSQFAILFLPMITASEEQTVFGRVIEGMDTISRLRRVDQSKKKAKGEVVLPPDRIIEATVIRRPDKLPQPKYSDLNQR